MSRFILLPPANAALPAPETGNGTVVNEEVLVDHYRLNPVGREALQSLPLVEVDKIATTGVQLLESTESTGPFFIPGWRLFPERILSLEDHRYQPLQVANNAASTKFLHTFRITDVSGIPLPNITVIMVSSKNPGDWQKGITGKDGRIHLQLRSTSTADIYIYPDHTYHNKIIAKQDLYSLQEITLETIRFDQQDFLRDTFPLGHLPVMKRRLRIGIADSGIGPHSFVPVKQNMNLIRGEEQTACFDQLGHGTQVAGIIQYLGKNSDGLSYIDLYNYRVVDDTNRASTFDILKAIEQAKADSCDILLLGPTGIGSDEVLLLAMKDAFENGLLCIYSAPEPPVYQAMSHKQTTASTIIKLDLFNSLHDLLRTKKLDTVFKTSYSLAGVAVTSYTQQLSVISAYPENKWCMMAGKDVAAPIACGLSARLLSNEEQILAMPRNAKRSLAMQDFLNEMYNFLPSAV